tara:strand:- start:342 stop:587 length:246 start_codon:yes stop_codon:yes gene_type:complete
MEEVLMSLLDIILISFFLFWGVTIFVSAIKDRRDLTLMDTVEIVFIVLFLSDVGMDNRLDEQDEKIDYVIEMLESNNDNNS